jgi:hypothetical protein
MSDKQSEMEKAAIKRAADISLKIREAVRAALPTPNEQYFTVMIPGKVVNYDVSDGHSNGNRPSHRNCRITPFPTTGANFFLLELSLLRLNCAMICLLWVPFSLALQVVRWPAATQRRSASLSQLVSTTKLLFHRLLIHFFRIHNRH